MAKDAVWGETLEIMAAAAAFGVNISVHVGQRRGTHNQLLQEELVHHYLCGTADERRASGLPPQVHGRIFLHFTDEVSHYQWKRLNVVAPHRVGISPAPASALAPDFTEFLNVEDLEELRAKIKRNSISASSKQKHLKRLQDDIDSLLMEASMPECVDDDQAVLQLCIEDLQTRIHQVSQELLGLTDEMNHHEELSKQYSEKGFAKVVSAPRQDEEDSNFRWRTAGSLIFKASRKSTDFVEQTFRALHRELCAKVSGILDCNPSDLHASSECFSGQELSDSYEEFCSDKTFRQLYALSIIECHVSFARATLSNPIKMCHINDQESFEQFMSAAKKVRIAWRNSNPQYWSDPDFGPFEMAKLFCRSLGTDPPLGFRSFEPSSLFRLLSRCTFFSQIIESRQLLRERTIQGVIWSYKCWSSALSTRLMDAENLGRIRSSLSVFLQEVGLVNENRQSLLSGTKIKKYFEMAIDLSGLTGVSSSTSESSRRGKGFDFGSDSDNFSSSGVSSSTSESSRRGKGFDFGSDSDNFTSSGDVFTECEMPEDIQHPELISRNKVEKMAAAQHAAAHPFCATDLEFAALKLREGFVAAQVTSCVLSIIISALILSGTLH
jgi:hypothetical protein